MTESHWYNCIITTEEILYQLACPEVMKCGTPATGLATFQPVNCWKDF